MAKPCNSLCWEQFGLPMCSGGVIGEKGDSQGSICFLSFVRDGRQMDGLQVHLDGCGQLSEPSSWGWHIVVGWSFLKYIKCVFPYLPASIQAGTLGFSSSFSTIEIKPTGLSYVLCCLWADGEEKEEGYLLSSAAGKHQWKMQVLKLKGEAAIFWCQNTPTVYSVNMQYVYLTLRFGLYLDYYSIYDLLL